MNNKLFNFIFCILLFLLFIGMANLFNSSFIFVDDCYNIMTIKSFSLKEIFESPRALFMFVNFFEDMFSVIFPQLMNIHPSDFKSKYFCYIQSAFFLFFTFLFYKILIPQELLKKEKMVFFKLISFLFIISLMFLIIQKQPYILFIYDGFFRMIFSPFLFICLFYKITKKLEKEKTTKQDIIKSAFLTFFCTISTEPICITTTLGLLLIFFIFKIKKADTNHLKLISFCLFAAFCGVLFFIKTGTFIRYTEGEIIEVGFIHKIISIIKPFSITYFKHIILNHIIPLAIITGLLILNKKCENKEVFKNHKIVIGSFLFGILTFFVGLICVTRPHYSEGGFYVGHSDLHIIFLFILSTFIFLLLNTSLNSKIIKVKHLSIILLITTIFFSIKNYDFYTRQKVEIEKLRIETYKTEKSLRIADSKNEIAILDKNIENEAYLWGLSFCTKEQNGICIQSPYTEFLNQFEKEEKFKNGFVFGYRNDYNLSQEELNNIEFTNLLDRDFLNK